MNDSIPTNTSGTPQRPHFLIGTPCYGGLCTVDFVSCLLKTKQYFEPKGIGVGVGFLSNESLIPRGRNTICAKFLANKNFTHLIFIDSDITWAPEDIAKLLAHGKDVSGGCYPKKRLHLDRIPQLLKELGELAKREGKSVEDIDTAVLNAKIVDYVMNFGPDVRQEGNLLKLKHIGTGFMMITRAAFEKMVKEYPYLKYDDDHDVLTKEENEWLYAFFDTDIAEKHYLSEDYLFCKRWQDMGGEIFADLTIALSHTGPHKFTGHYGMSLLNLNSVKTNPFRNPTTVNFVPQQKQEQKQEQLSSDNENRIVTSTQEGAVFKPKTV